MAGGAQAGRVKDALAVLSDMRGADIPPDTQLYNLTLVAATKSGPPRAALEVYQQCAPRPPAEALARGPFASKGGCWGASTNVWCPERHFDCGS